MFNHIENDNQHMINTRIKIENDMIKMDDKNK